MLHTRLVELSEFSELMYVDVSALAGVDRQFLVERQLISREHAESAGARAVAIEMQENYSLMINEEDHLRMQVIRSGRFGSVGANQPHRRPDRGKYRRSTKNGLFTACPRTSAPACE
jgi:protein arginine kinase